jgi:mono/diheme cytochrome c family protein
MASICVCATAIAVEGGGTAHASPRPLTAGDAAAGKALYLRECSGCHGERGNGGGPAAGFVDPRPRDFTKRRFKLRTTESGAPPTTSDILRTIERGVPGTAMPSFAFLSDGERKQIAAYVLKLADLLDEPEAQSIVDTTNAPPATPGTIAKGKQLYIEAECFKCHGNLGAGDGPSADELKDEDGRPIRPRNLVHDLYRGGADRNDIYARLVTGMDGTPMPSYGDVIEGPDMWGLVDYVVSLRVPPAAKPRHADPILAGREVAAKYSCGGCHVLDDGKGGAVGPDLRVSAQKLFPEWVRAFLNAPREYGKIYPWRIYRMPDLRLSDEEVEVMTSYLAAMGKRRGETVTLPDVSKFPADKLAEGQLIFILRCTECHNLGNVIPIPSVKQQGPDLIRVTRRVDYDWAKSWILNPRNIDPNTRMIVPDITPEQVDAVRMFVWKAAIEADKRAAAAREPRLARMP